MPSETQPSPARRPADTPPKGAREEYRQGAAPNAGRLRRPHDGRAPSARAYRGHRARPGRRRSSLAEGARQLVQRAAVLGAFIESCEAKWLGGEAVPLADYLAAINSQRRVLATIGLERRARDVTPLRERLAAHAGAA